MAHFWTPLTDEEKELPSGMLLPSGEENFLDGAQKEPSLFPINKPFPVVGSGVVKPSDPKFGSLEYFDESGVYETFPENTGIPPRSPVPPTDISESFLAPVQLTSTFSNAAASLDSLAASGIDDFKIFNSYIHYYPSTITGQVPPPADYAIRIDYKMVYERVSTWGTYKEREPYRVDIEASGDLWGSSGVAPAGSATDTTGSTTGGTAPTPAGGDAEGGTQELDAPSY
tara:strand:+ start:512 stop:1195 length:684 start_codon:yes stop_codon:yes gene_type:complete